MSEMRILVVEDDEERLNWFRRGLGSTRIEA
jgi:hypothetical protein